MIKTLVSIEVDLASSRAIRLACQLGELMNMQIQPVYVKESPPHESVWGAGWTSRTWEKEMVQQGHAEISELLTAEQDSCAVLEEPRVIYGDREGELLKIAQGEEFDIFIEGAHFPWTVSDLYKRLHSKLYQRIPSPVILVRALRKVNHVQLLCFDAKGAETLTNVVQTLWQGCRVPLVLSYPGKDLDKTEAEVLREAVDRADGLLTEAGCTVTVRDTLSLTPREDAVETLKDCGLVAIAVERAVKKDCSELQWLSEVKTSSLLAFR
ncbi:MAG: hypothetical protein P8182_07850 [Deltaproteobacteria bacterium]